MYNFNNQDKNSIFSLWQNKKKKEYYYDFGTGKSVKIPFEEKDPFLEGFNSTQNSGTSGKQEFPINYLPNTETKEVKPKNILGDPNAPLKITQYGNTQAKIPQGSYIGGDLKTDKEKSLFMEGFRAEAPKSQTQNADAIEFGEDSETYKILQDLGKRWYQADPEEQARLHKEAETVRRLARDGYIVEDRTEKIMDTMRNNAEIAKEFLRQRKSIISSPLTEMGDHNYFLDSAAYLIGMVNHGPWDYKYDDRWRFPIVDEKTTYGGYDLTKGHDRNWLPWMYFDGHLIGADKVGNMNMAYVGKKMGLPEWVYKNWFTMDKDDPEWVERGISLAESGR